MKGYTFAVLRSDDTAEAAAYNDALLGSDTLGIEVTAPSLAARCGLGNNDPQHRDGAAGRSSACEDMFEWPLPPNGAILVTIRPDRDAVVAFAIARLRLLGRADAIDRTLVLWIGAMDRLGFRGAKEKYPELYDIFKGAQRHITDAIHALAIATFPAEISIEDRVMFIGKILCGEMSKRDMCITASFATRRELETVGLDLEIEWHGSIAFVEEPGQYHWARDRVNNPRNVLCPVAVISDPQYQDRSRAETPYQRYSIVRQEGHFDSGGFRNAINAAEARARGITLEALANNNCLWGGPNNIVTSPKNRVTALTRKQILDLVLEYAENGIVS